MNGRWHRIGWGLALLLGACGDTLGPPPAAPQELPPLGPPATPLANRPAGDELLPEEAAAQALAGFLGALGEGDCAGAASYLDPGGGSLVRDLRAQLEGPPEARERARAFLAGAEPEALTEVSETRVVGRMKLGPGLMRTFGVELSRDRHGLWLLARLHGRPAR